MALNLDISSEELASWTVSEEEMAELLINLDLIDEKSYRLSKLLKEKNQKQDDLHLKKYSESKTMINNNYKDKSDFKNTQNFPYKKNMENIKESITFDRVA